MTRRVYLSEVVNLVCGIMMIMLFVLLFTRAHPGKKSRLNHFPVDGLTMHLPMMVLS